jgi:hypothetical protein
MAESIKTEGHWFVIPQDVNTLREAALVETTEAVNTIVRLHKSVYGVDLTKETKHENHYGRKV